MKRTITSTLGIIFALAAALLVATGNTSLAQTTKTNKTAKITAPVDVNNADLETLETLPGVGPSIAKKIVDGRPYKSLADLEKVKGLGKSRADAMKDLVTFGSAATPAVTTSTSASTPAKSSTDTSSSKTTSTTSSKPTKASADRLAAGEKVNINTASAEELDKIPGIGPTKAQAIVDYRTQNGNFKTIEDIQKVKGIKGGTFAKIKDYLKLE